MKLASAFLVVLFVCFAWTQSVTSQSSTKPEDLAQTSAQAWLALTDAGKYAESWQEGSTAFKAAVTQSKWVDMITPVRTPLGKVLSRKFKSATYIKDPPSAPAGEYVQIQYDTSFENRKDSVEVVAPMLDKDGKWRVSGYFIK
jgi:hypothetical protein